MDLKQQVQNVAAQGRYGDSMLLHVNPAEVRGLAQAVPLTINPQTGQPEAFLPFLAPIAGSLLGGSLLAGATGSALLGSAIGSGLAQYAVTGDLKKGLLAGLTGYGIGSALQGAGAAAQGAQAATAAEGAISQAATDAATQAALQDPTLVNTALQGPALEGAAGIGLNTAGQQAVDIAATEALAAGQPAIAQAAKTGFGDVMGSQGYLATDPTLGQAFKDAGGFSIEGGKNVLTGLTKPGAYIPASIGMGGTSIMESQELFEQMLARNEAEREAERQRIIAENPEMVPIATGGVTKMQEGGEVQREDYDLPDNFNAYQFNPYTGMYDGGRNYGSAGNYFGGPNLGSFTGQGYVQAREATRIDPYFMAGFQPEATYFENLNPSAGDITSGTTSSQTRINDMRMPSLGGRDQRMFNPTQTVGYQSFYGDQARDIVPQVVDPYAPVEFERTPPPMLRQPMPYPIALGDVETPAPITDPVEPTTPTTPTDPTTPIDDVYIPTPKTKADTVEPIVDTSEFVSPDLTILDELKDLDIPINVSEQVNIPEIDLSNLNIPTDLPQFNASDFDRLTLPPMLNRNYDVTDLIAQTRDFDFRAGGKQLKTIPEDNKGLSKLPEDVRNKMGYMQAGGNTEIMQDPLTSRLVQFLMGEIQDDTIVGEFVNKYGNEIFMQIREQVLQQIVPVSQTQGQINGNAAGGMADDIYGKIGATQGVAVSQDEYIIPADVMSMLGDGSSDAGAKKLDQMLDRVRMTKTGTTKQAKEIDDSKVMPA
jgi:hypothetical protein